MKTSTTKQRYRIKFSKTAFMIHKEIFYQSLGSNYHENYSNHILIDCVVTCYKFVRYINFRKFY